MTLALSVIGGLSSASAQEQPGQVDNKRIFGPVDPQQWVDQGDMTWADYVPVRPEEWRSAETSQGSEVQYQAAVILLDFEDEPFLITQEPESHPFGNPQSGFEPVAPEDVNEWYRDYYANPDNEYNGGQTFHSYWMEDSHGRIGVDVEVFGPYTLPGKLHEYGYDGFNSPQSTFCPEGDQCGKNIRGDGGALWRADIGCSSGLCGFDNAFFVTAGHDESTVWQEFGEMIFRTPDDVTDDFGPPRDADGNPPRDQQGNIMPNYANTRYVPWTSWRAAANHWPNAGGGTSTQAENTGQSTFAHEFSHLRGLPDNYNNPFATNPVRNYTGYWEMMSRGSFNGPGGTHNRWHVPNQGGEALGPHHMLHFKQSGSGRLGVLADDEHVEVNRHDLVDDGIAVVRLKARAHVPDGDLVGLTVHLGAGGFTPGACQDRVSDPFWCTPNVTNWQRFTMEVVDRVGNDSFVPGHGVLLAHARNSGTPRVHLVDANPEDIDRVDFYRPGNDEEPGGEPVRVVPGDPRQLDDATFHAGTDSDSEYEYVDEYNDLHFYVLDTFRDEGGALFYDVAVRNLNGAGDFDRDVEPGDVSISPVGGTTGRVTVDLTNTGEAGESIFGSDIFRISAETEAAGWDVWLPHEVRAAEAGATVPVAVYATAGDGAAESATVTITATSEADPDVSFSVEIELSSDDLKVTFDIVAELLTAYYQDGVIERRDVQRIQAQLNIAERNRGNSGSQALDRAIGFAEQIADDDAREAIAAIIEGLRSDL